MISNTWQCTMLQSLYIWSGHYAHKDAGWRLCDHKKGPVVAGCFLVVAGCFCWPFSLFVTFLLLVTFISYFLLLKGVKFVTFCYFFTTCNFHKLFFTGPGGPGFIFSSLWDGGRGCTLIFFLHFFDYLGGGRGLEVDVFFFSFHWKCGKRRGKGVNLGALEMFLALWRG